MPADLSTSPRQTEPNLGDTQQPIPRVPTTLRVSYVTMLFPADSETFASLDVKELGLKGLTIEVHSLRPRKRDVERLASERGVSHVKCTYNGIGSTLIGMAVMLRRLPMAWWALTEFTRMLVNSPRELIKSIVLIPRVFDIFERLWRRPPDVVHVYWGHYPAMVGALVQRYLPDTIVTMSLGAYDLEANYPVTKDVAKRATFVRTHGRCNVSDLVRRVGVRADQVAVVYNGIDLTLVPRDVLTRKRKPGRIVTSGRLIAGKAVDEVLRAFRLVHQRYPDATLDIFGDGPERSRLVQVTEQLDIGRSVTFHGHVSQSAMFEALADAEVFLFMSRSKSERLPNVLKEAMACGAICVTTNSIGLDELILDRSFGIILPHASYEGAAEAVLEILSDLSGFADVRKNAHARITEHFDVRRTTLAYVRRWSAAVAERSDYSMRLSEARPRLGIAPGQSDSKEFRDTRQGSGG